MIIKAKDIRKVVHSNQPILLVICKHVLLNVDELDKALHSSVVALLQEFDDVFSDEIPDGLPPIRGLFLEHPYPTNEPTKWVRKKLKNSKGKLMAY